MAGAGYRPDEIDEMGWHDVVGLLDHWTRWPPPHEAIRRIGIGLGIEKEIKKMPTAEQIRTTAPAGCLTIAELERLAANTNMLGGLAAHG